MNFPRKKFPLFLFVIVILGTFLRFYQLPYRLYFQLDEERDLLLARRAVYAHDLPLIGQHVPGGIFLGPIYIWTTATISWLINFNPFILGYLASFMGVVAIIAIYAVSKTLFSRKVGMISALLWSTSFLIGFFNQIWWPLVFTPLVTLTTYYCLLQLKKKQKCWVYPLIIALTLGIQSDPATISLLLTTVVLWIIWKFPITKHTLIGIGILIISHTPLVIFDLTHNFQNSRSLLLLFTGSSAPARSVQQLMQSIGSTVMYLLTVVYGILFPHIYPDRSTIITWCSEYSRLSRDSLSPTLTIATTVLIGIPLVLRRKLSDQSSVLSIHLLISTFGIFVYQLLYPGYLHIWFFSVLFPALVILMSAGIASLSRHAPYWSGLLFLGCVVVTNAFISLKLENRYALGYKQEAVQFAISQVQKTDRIEIRSVGHCFGWSGYRYLFVWSGTMPVSSYLDRSFGPWLFPSELTEQKGNKVITFVDHESIPFPLETQKEYQKAKRSAIISKRFGAIEVLIANQP